MKPTKAFNSLTSLTVFLSGCLRAFQLTYLSILCSTQNKGSFIRSFFCWSTLSIFLKFPSRIFFSSETRSLTQYNFFSWMDADFQRDKLKQWRISIHVSKEFFFVESILEKSGYIFLLTTVDNVGGFGL